MGIVKKSAASKYPFVVDYMQRYSKFTKDEKIVDDYAFVSYLMKGINRVIVLELCFLYVLMDFGYINNFIFLIWQ